MCHGRRESESCESIRSAASSYRIIFEALLAPNELVLLTIIIEHRLSTILKADEILIMKEGSIIKRGVHADLLKLNGLYTELYETQFKTDFDEDNKES